MAEKKWELLQKDVTAAFTPLVARRNFYRDGLVSFRLRLQDYFFNPTLTDSLAEVPKPGERPFDFAAMQKGLALCLNDENVLTERALELQQATVGSKFSLVNALDSLIANCGLPFARDEEEGYAFNINPSFTPKARDYMCQFAYGLSLYRAYLGVLDVYFNLFNYPFVKVDEAQVCREAALDFRASLTTAEASVYSLWKDAKTRKKHLKSLQGALYGEFKDFETTYLTESPRLALWFDVGAKTLEACYRAFPNTSKVFLMYDSSWQILLKDSARALFQAQYTWSTLKGTLTILPAFSEGVFAEIMQFHQVALEKQRELKSTLLNAGILEYDGALATIRDWATQTGVKLIEAPVHNATFSSFSDSLASSRLKYWPAEKDYSPASTSGYGV